MAINKIPKNYYSDTNIRRDKINEIIDEVNDIASIPSPSAEDAGKIVKVSEEGEYELADDAGTVLPTPAVADAGKVVKVSDEGSYELADDEGTVLPTPTAADAGKVLGVDSNGAWELDNIPSELPTVTSADSGKVLTVDSQGVWTVDNIQGNKKIYSLIPSSTDNFYDFPSGITGADIYDEFLSGKDIELRIIHNTFGTVIVKPATYINNAIFFSALFYDSNGSTFRTVRCTIDNLNTETSTRPFFAIIS